MSAPIKFDYVREPDASYNVGRCNACSGRPVYCWTAKTLAAKNDTILCPVCHHVLDSTSRLAYGSFRVLDDAYVVGQMWQNASRMYVSAVGYSESASAARKNDEDDYRASLWQDRADSMNAAADKLMLKAGKMAAAAVGAFLRSQECRDCHRLFTYSEDADYCPSCVVENVGADYVAPDWMSR